MAKLKDIWEQIEKGRGFKAYNWKEYFYIKQGDSSSVFIEEIFGDNWELEPLPKESLKLFQAVFRIRHFINGRAIVSYMIPERLYINEEDAKKNKPSLNFVCELNLLKLIAVNFESENEHN